MAKKASSGMNRSQAIRELYKSNPSMPVKEVISTLAGNGIEVKPGLVYMIKGKLSAQKGGRRKKRRKHVPSAVSAPATSTNGDVLGTINKIKKLAAEVGGLKKLKALVEALAE